MSPTPEADIAAPKDPAEYRPRALLGVSFWVMIAFGLACVLAGVGIAVLAPRVWAQRPAARSLEAPAAPAEAPRSNVTLPAAAETLAAPPPAIEPAAAPQVAQLSNRVAALEAQQGRTSRAAASALAAAALVEASQGSRPFPEEIAAVRAVSGASPELAQLSRLAQSGAPSRASLIASFPDYAARAASSARKPAEGGSLSDRIVYALSRVVMVRRISDVSGDGPDALIARAERALEDGDFDRAFTALDKLPPAARDTMSPWRVRAERRADIDRYAGALRARALADVAAAGRSGA
ncbi:hypothetical protein [Phenylobacterium sp.]|uniref:COG4223 family protein n=1 Tax=Phenylobacterium sp. TaxID=1871053 RepID=UPI002DEC759F|nr:hypothetical protein [Phenylobacterium sp.]